MGAVPWTEGRVLHRRILPLDDDGRVRRSQYDARPARRHRPRARHRGGEAMIGTKSNRETILAFLRTGPKTIQEVADHLGVNGSTAGVQLSRLRDRGATKVSKRGAA